MSQRVKHGRGPVCVFALQVSNPTSQFQSQSCPGLRTRFARKIGTGRTIKRQPATDLRSVSSVNKTRAAQQTNVFRRFHGPAGTRGMPNSSKATSQRCRIRLGHISNSVLVRDRRLPVSLSLIAVML